jgi:XTP/dITP diphosphohydrolase
MHTLLVATTNKGKLGELKEILAGLDLHLVDLSDMDRQAPEVEEDGVTFADNALKKARAYSDFYNLPTIADDSGLEVKALDNRPGVFSARYAATDELRNERLLRELKEVGEETDRSAQFVCVAAFADSSRGVKKIFEGSVEGEITKEPIGDQGFGYDPVFYFPPLHKTFAQMSMQEKNEVSHRRRAFGALKEWLTKEFNKG